MSGRDDGGPAFPNITPDMPIQGGPGMSLRDYLAGQALVGVMVTATGLGDISTADRALALDKVAAILYEAADAMIRERIK